jgi:hypothetical protein
MVKAERRLIRKRYQPLPCEYNFLLLGPLPVPPTFKTLALRGST